MCGIAGILGRPTPLNREALRRLSEALSHRGPDGHGFYESPADARGNACLLAHRRLAILDLTTAADQPMVDRGRPAAMVYNGEIYNYTDLRSRLSAEGETFSSSGDTEVLFRALMKRGAAACRDLRGMFAFAWWDESARRLLLARDALGIKPLYVARNPDPNGAWSLVFASEVRAILASGLLGKPRLNPSAVASVVWNGFVMGPQTAVAGIESLSPGQFQVFDGAGRPEQTEYFWSIPASDPQGPRIDEAELGRSLSQCVKSHLASDVPLGVFLSGGVDSSAVAHLAQQASPEPIHTFTMAFEEEGYNEAPFARKISEALGTRHREVVLTESRFTTNLDRALQTLDQPTFDGLNSYFMSQAVREAGLTVALSGAGGDELFGGYTSFRHLPRLARLARVGRLIPSVAKVGAARMVAGALQKSGGSVEPQTRWAKLPDMVRAGDDLLRLYQLAYTLFVPKFQAELLAEGLASDLSDGMPPAMHRRLRDEMAGRPTLSSISALEQRCFLGERLLRDSDAAGMAVSLEMRLPLVDTGLLETVNRLDEDLRYRPVGAKAILRRVGLAGLDPRLFQRPKSGFVLPFDTWLKRHLGRQMEETMNDGSLAAAVGLNGGAVSRLWTAYRDGAPGLYWSRAWALYVLIHWCHRHRVLL
ncbi:MAG TPA: asparagine synthase (glutamine-hydrolyzing) [Planctomycetota bacterium]|nr:asparagine synthase (glutamine-hydrolyzing) [Planctomycetota bacterium]